MSEGLSGLSGYGGGNSGIAIQEMLRFVRSISVTVGWQVYS